MKKEELKYNIQAKIECAKYCCYSYLESSTIILYSIIDAVSWLYSNEQELEKRKPGEEFKCFVKKFIIPNLPGYDITSEELWLARCSLVHTNSAIAKNQRNNRMVMYCNSDESRVLQNKVANKIDSNTISLNIKDLIWAVEFGIEKFINNIDENKAKEIDEKTKYWYIDLKIDK